MCLGAEEPKALRGSKGSGSTMAAETLNVKKDGLIFFPPSSSQFRHLDLVTTQLGEKTTWQDFS